MATSVGGHAMLRANHEKDVCVWGKAGEPVRLSKEPRRTRQERT